MQQLYVKKAIAIRFYRGFAMKKNYIAIILLSSVFLVGCSTQSNMGKEIHAQSEVTEHLASDWETGNKLLKKGAAAREQGIKLVQKGEHKIMDGKNIIQKGNEKINDGNNMVTLGTHKMKVSENVYHESFPTVPTQP